MKTVNKLAISIALLFLVVELSNINAKSLIYLSDASSMLDKAFAVAGSIAFSVVTILVMMNSVIKWPKYVFPVFDAGLMFLGLNLRHFDNLFNDLGRLYLTAFMSLFTGLITYSLGVIEFKNFKTDTNDKQSYFEQKWKSLGLRFDSLAKEHNSLKVLNGERMDQLQENQRQIQALKSELKSKQTDIEKMKDVYMKAEVSRIKKKSEINRTDEEIELLKKAC